MENSEKNLGNKEMPQYPKPSDELQKHIETVIPDGENEAVDDANGKPEQAADKQVDVAPSTEKPEQDMEEKPKDAGDGIETVSN